MYYLFMREVLVFILFCISCILYYDCYAYHQHIHTHSIRARYSCLSALQSKSEGDKSVISKQKILSSFLFNSREPKQNLYDNTIASEKLIEDNSLHHNSSNDKSVTSSLLPIYNDNQNKTSNSKNITALVANKNNSTKTTNLINKRKESQSYHIQNYSATGKNKYKSTKPQIDFEKLDPNTVVTVDDLKTFLAQNQYVRLNDIKNITISSSAANVKKSKSKDVAFPQPSVLTRNAIVIGCSVSSSMIGMVIASSLLPNLWLLGSIIGAVVGHKVGVTAPLDDQPIPGNLSLLSQAIISVGKQIAKAYLLVFDFINSIWFLYKTGQLSYNYLKQYQSLDEKYQIQNKIDAWNARFKEGKENFDKWEKENEVGRKVLAGLRTVWLVEEQSLRSRSTAKKKKNKYRYRIVEYGKSFFAWLNRLVHALWNIVTGGGAGEAKELMANFQNNMKDMNIESFTRILGGGFLAYVVVNLIGTLWVVAPSILELGAIILGCIYPEWMRMSYQTAKNISLETQSGGGKTIKRAPTDAGKKLDKKDNWQDFFENVFHKDDEIEKSRRKKKGREEKKKKSGNDGWFSSFDFTNAFISSRRGPERKVWGGRYTEK